ncbi:MAG: tellurite resistance protein TehB [Chloroflexi bacterium ADurb.Bin325]|nr:MAG: tellurite resistance protein TehB [Chloroflexi bacterium ADurb.Bin325]
MYREYGELSTMLYEFTKPIGYSIDGDIEYYSRKLENVTGRILEAGVGTGRMLIPLIKNGSIVDGVDSSAEMLKQCRLNLGKHGVEALLYEQDLVDLSLPHKYEAIIIPTGSFCLLPRERIEEVLKAFYNHLEEGGRLIVDLEMPISFKEGATNTSSFLMTEDTGIILTSYSERIDWVGQKTSSINRYELVEKGRIIKTEISNFVMYWYGVSEFRILLSFLGYKDISYELGYGKGGSELITFTAYK